MESQRDPEDVLVKSAEGTLTGACYCRAITYAVADEFEYALICHCTDCQRSTGSAFKPFGGIAATKLTVTAGGSEIAQFGDEHAHNAFCQRCGSLLYSLVRDGEYVHVTYGTLLDAPGRMPSAHIFVRSKASWHVIGDDLPQFQAFPE
jgi:hypothetical protein